MRYAFVLITALLACDTAGQVDADTDTDTAGDPTSSQCPTLCDGTCPPECVPDPCYTVGDWCAPDFGAQQCGGGRMDCVAGLGGDGWGACAVPCVNDDECPRGHCTKAGACFDGGQIAAPAKCGD